MKLSLSKVVNGARLGVINSLGRNGDKTLEVPGCLLYTKTCSPPHLTHDTLQTIEGVPSVTHITLSTLAEHQEVLEEYKEGVGKFAGMPDAVLYCSIHDPVTVSPTGYNTNKALKRSVVIGAVEGGDVLEERLRSARETAKRPVGGFLLDGLQGDTMSRETKLSLVSSVTAVLPEDKPRLIHGVGKPDEVLECIERGVDLFDSCFPYQVTERGCALYFNHSYHPDPETAVLEKSEMHNVERNGDVATERVDPQIDESDMTSFEICLKEKRFREDLGPLLPGCTCYCCRNHSRAYVHHLLMSNELLAGILLMIHNFQHYFGFFRSAREALRDGALDTLREMIRRQAS
ncbi:hypothetical protein FKM82_009985 [Ascaphus truei]